MEEEFEGKYIPNPSIVLDLLEDNPNLDQEDVCDKVDCGQCDFDCGDCLLSPIYAGRNGFEDWKRQKLQEKIDDGQ